MSYQRYVGLLPSSESSLAFHQRRDFGFRWYGFLCVLPKHTYCPLVGFHYLDARLCLAQGFLLFFYPHTRLLKSHTTVSPPPRSLCVAVVLSLFSPHCRNFLSTEEAAAIFDPSQWLLLKLSRLLVAVGCIGEFFSFLTFVAVFVVEFGGVEAAVAVVAFAAVRRQ